MAEQTYEMEFRCSNCGKWFLRKVEKGESAKGRGGECYYCGRQDSVGDSFQVRLPGPFPYAVTFSIGEGVIIVNAMTLKEAELRAIEDLKNLSDIHIPNPDLHINILYAERAMGAPHVSEE